MDIKEPVVEFVPIKPEQVIRASGCGGDVESNCIEGPVKASWEGCGCSDGLNFSLVPCDDNV